MSLKLAGSGWRSNLPWAGAADIGASTPAMTVLLLSTLTNYHSDEMAGSGPAPGWGAE